MIELVTGLPGSGKTLSTIWRYKEISERDNRPVYYHGIHDLALPWIELEDPTKWMEVEPNAIVIIDECQRTFRPSGPSQGLPPHIAALETHRHGGIDLVLMTQQPMLIHRNVRELVGHHLHVVRMFGASRSMLHEWDQCRDNPRTSRKDSRQSMFKYPKEAYALYKSAEVHTHKRNIPARVWIMFACPFIAGALLWVGYTQMRKINPAVAAEHQQASAGVAPVAAGGTASGSQRAAPLTAAEYMETYKPRLAHMPHTASRYDGVTQPKVAPRPAACYSMSSRGCKCFTQQGTPYSIDANICEEIVAHGFFVDWDDSGVAAQSGPAEVRPAVYPTIVDGQVRSTSGGSIADPDPARSKLRLGG